MYHVVSTGIAAALLYLISYTFSLMGFYSPRDHRKLWNFVLAASFILTALAGLFLALQINYKWNIPFIKTILKWHVECGAGLAITGIFHFIRHMPYFSSFFQTDDTVDNDTATFQLSPLQIRINLFLVGFVSTSVQILLMREMMNIAGGYELIAGTFLGSWLICSAAGAVMARRSQINDLRKINLVFGISPLLSVVLMILLNRLFLNSGESPSFFISVIFTLIILLPFCFVSGFAFIRILDSSRKFDISSGKLFSVETAGGIVAGIALTILTSGILNTYRLLLLIVTGFLCYYAIYYSAAERKRKILAALVPGFIVVLIFLFNPDILIRQLYLNRITITSTEDTPYGNISKGKYGGEESIYYNQRLVTWKNDEIEREENIHYAMLQSESPGKVLLISGDIRSNIPEVIKYPVKEIYYVERDPSLIKLNNLNDDYKPYIIRTESNDGYSFVRKSKELFDVIIVILPPPSTLLLNRYYTTDFFREVKKKLAKDGVFACSPGSGDNYFNKESVILYSCIYNSLSNVFTNVIPIAGNKLYFIASEGKITSSVCTLVLKRKISNIYVNADFLSDDLLNKKSAEILAMIDHNVKLNSAGVPVACFHFQSYNLSKNKNERIPSLILLTIVFLLPLISVGAKNMIMYTSASALAGFEIVMLVTLQSSVGNMYQLTGLVIAALMTGLAAGAASGFRFTGSRSPRLCPLFLIMFYFSAALIIRKLLVFESPFLTVCAILLLSLIPSFFTGVIFRKLTEGNKLVSETSRVYSADLAGSALGFIVISGLVIPALGIRITLFLLSGLILSGVLFGTIGNKS